jgi:hypothetical protein
MAIDDTYILLMFMYVVTGQFEMPDIFSAMIMRDLAKIPDKAGEDDHHSKKHEKIISKHHTNKVDAIAKGHFAGAVLTNPKGWLNDKFTSLDMSRLCTNCRIIDALNLTGISFKKACLLFVHTSRQMGQLLKDRCSRRLAKPHEREKWDKALRKYDAEHRKKEHELSFIMGRTEFSILMEALYCMMPKRLFGGVLDMCVKLLAKLGQGHQPKISHAYTCPVSSLFADGLSPKGSARSTPMHSGRSTPRRQGSKTMRMGSKKSSLISQMSKCPSLVSSGRSTPVSPMPPKTSRAKNSSFLQLPEGSAPPSRSQSKESSKSSRRNKFLSTPSSLYSSDRSAPPSRRQST